jgi:hypothetical protein
MLPDRFLSKSTFLPKQKYIPPVFRLRSTPVSAQRFAPIWRVSRPGETPSQPTSPPGQPQPPPRPEDVPPGPGKLPDEPMAPPPQAPQAPPGPTEPPVWATFRHL